MKTIWNIFKQTAAEWSEDKAPRLAAALAYYTAFSLAPILVITIALVGIFYGQANAQSSIIAQVQNLAGEQAGTMVQSMLDASRNMGSNVLATILGVIALIFGATGVFGQLQDAMNTMWEVKPDPQKGIFGYLRKRLFSFGMVLVVGFLLLVSLILSAALVALGNWSLSLFPGFEIVMQIVNFVVSFLLVTLLFALLFKYVPDAKIRWRDVWLGAAFTALLFTIGKFLISLYLGSSNVVTSFGAAGSLVVILLWVYYAAQISFFGAEFTQVYANHYGKQIVPEEHARQLSETERAEQGMDRKGEQAKPLGRSAGGQGQLIPQTGRGEPGVAVRYETGAGEVTPENLPPEATPSKAELQSAARAAYALQADSIPPEDLSRNVVPGSPTSVMLAKAASTRKYTRPSSVSADAEVEGVTAREFQARLQKAARMATADLDEQNRDARKAMKAFVSVVGALVTVTSGLVLRARTKAKRCEYDR